MKNTRIITVLALAAGMLAFTANAKAQEITNDNLEAIQMVNETQQSIRDMKAYMDDLDAPRYPRTVGQELQMMFDHQTPIAEMIQLTGVITIFLLSLLIVLALISKLIIIIVTNTIEIREVKRFMKDEKQYIKSLQQKDAKKE